MSETSTVTILFTDVVGSVELRTKHGDESAHKLMEKHFDLVRGQIAHHSGQEVKTMGDGFMVAFTSARQAVDCAVALQQALAEYNTSHPEEQVRVRIGLNTGEAIEKEGDLFGAAVDAAARIMSKAAGGQILLSEHTRGVIGAAKELELIDRGPFWLKGFPERWRLYEVLWQEDKVSSAPVTTHIGHRTPFVGRESERADLRRFLDSARGGHGSLIMIGGEPGVGKTRITEELATEADRHGFLTLTGHCYEMEGAPPYIPFIEILQSIMRTVEPDAFLEILGDAAPEAAKLVPELRQRFPDIPEPRKLAPEQERLYLFNNIRDFFERLGGQRPLLLVFEDLHWADESTMLLLQHIAPRLGDMPVLAVGTYRDTELDVARALAKALEDLLRRRLAHDVVLRRLSETGVAAMLKGGRSQEEPPARLVELIYRETEGNPFFVEEIFKHLAEEGKLYDMKGGWRSDLEIDEAEVPRGIRLVIGRRLERVSEDCRHVLSSAAVIGRGVDFELLEQLAPIGEEALFDALDEAERAQLIRSRTEGGKAHFVFSHELIRQTLVSSLSLLRRQRAHVRVAETIERLYADALEDHAADLAYHFYQGGGDSEKIINYSIIAAERATAQTAYEEAVDQYERALQTLELEHPVDELQQCDLLLALGRAYGNAGDPDHAKETLLRVTEIARKLPAPEHFAEALMELSRFWYALGSEKPLINLMNESLDLLGKGDSAIRASLMGHLSLLSIYSPNERSIAFSEEALSMARRVGDPKALYYALHGRAVVWNLPLEERIAAAAELAELEEKADSPEAICRGLNLLNHLRLEQGDIAAFDAGLAAIKRRAAETLHPSLLWNSTIAEATRAQMIGQFEEAERLALESLALGQRVNEVSGNAICVLIMQAIRHLQGRLDEIDGAFRRQAEDYPDAPRFRPGIVWLHLHMGREEQARQEFEHLARNDFADLPWYYATLLILMYLSEVAAAFRDTRRAALLYDLLHPFANRLLTAAYSVACFGSTAHWLGLLGGILRRWDAAVAHFEEAIETNARVGARPYLARSQHEYARMLIERNESDDKEKARNLLSEATAAYRDIGMPTFLEDAEELLAGL